MTETNEQYGVIASSKSILTLAIYYVQQYYPLFSAHYIERKILARERLGSTYVGDGTLLLHVVSKKIVNEQGFYLFLLQPQAWQSLFDQQKYEITKVLILCVNPEHSEHKFGHLEWALNYQLTKKLEVLAAKDVNMMHKI